MLVERAIGLTAVRREDERPQAVEPRIGILIPCYNEELTIAEVIQQFRADLPRADIYEFDNKSSDRPVDEVFMCGGGAYNPVLVEMVEEQLSPRKVSRHDDYGIPADIREAVTFAIATARNFAGLPTSPTQVTGARRSVVLGNFTPGQFCWDSVPFTRARG